MKKFILFVFIFFIFLTPEVFGGRGGGGGSFFGRSSGGSSWSSGRDISFPGFIYIGGGSGGIIFFVLLGIGILVFKNIAENRKLKSSLVSIKLGFYLGKAELVKQVKEILKNMSPDDINSCYIALREIGVLVLRNANNIRWYDLDIKNFSNIDLLENEFNKIISEERIKYDKEEYLNIKGLKKESKEINDNLEEVFIISINVAVFSYIKMLENTIYSTLSAIKEVSSIARDNFGGVSIFYNIMDKDDIISIYPELKII